MLRLLRGGISATKRADQQGGEPIRRRRILWETAQVWNGGVAEWSRVWDFEEWKLESPINIRQLSRATPSFHDWPNEGVREGVNQSGFCSKWVRTISYKHHQNEFEEKIGSVLRTSLGKSARKFHGVFQSTENVPEARRRFYKWNLFCVITQEPMEKDL